jgi:tetratricopeptide (TPR) repeat protein
MTHTPASTLLALVAAAAALAAQSPEPKTTFLQATGQFSLALEGSFGDEGAQLRSSLDAMERSSRQWDDLIQGYEKAMAADLRAAAPAQATRLHLSLAGVYLDRNRTADSLRELAAARQLDQTRVEIPMFEGLSESQLAGNHLAATAAFRRAAELKPDDSVSGYLFARSLARVGAADEANQVYQRFAANEVRRTGPGAQAVTTPFSHLGLFPETAGVEPFFPPVLYADGFAELQRGNHARAIELLRQASAGDPIADTGVQSGAVSRAAAAFRNGAIASVLESLAVAIELAPDRSDPHRIVGLVRLANREPGAAIDALNHAITLNPRDERARLALADALIASDALPAARQSLLDTLAAFPASGRAHYKLASVYQRQGLYPDAVRELTSALASKPMLGMNSLYQTLGALARAQQQYDAAIEAFSQRVDLVPNSADAHQELGEMYFRQSRHTEALAEFLVTLMLDPSRTDTHAAVGQVHLRTGNYADAAAAARRAIALDATHKEARYVLATALVRLGNVDEGKRELEIYQRLQTEATALRSRQLEVEGFRRDASLSLANGETEKAIDLLRRALAQDPSASSQLDLGVALLKGGRAQEAIEQLTAAAAKENNEAVHGYLADAYTALGRREEAERERAILLRMRQDALRKGVAR